jgi:4-hydroxybenzoate polyprenyltransferase
MLGNIKTYLEKVHITPISWLVGMSGIFMVRFFLESLSNPTSTGFFASDASTLIHYYLFFLTAAMVFMIFLQMAIPSWKRIAPQFVSISFLVIFVAPIVDWIVSGGKGLKMTYLFDTPKEMLHSLLFFLVKNFDSGVTFGLRIEGILILLSFGLLVYFISKNWKRAVVSSLVFYVIFFTFASLPGIISLIGQNGHPAQSPLIFLGNSIANSSTISNNLHGTLQYSSAVRLLEISFNFIMGKIFFLILIALVSLWFYSNFKEKFKAMVKNLRSERMIHFILMIFFGLLVAYVFFPFTKFNWNDWLSVIVLCFSLFFSILFAICVNDIVDEDIDAVSNAGRPLITKSLNKEDMKQMAFMFLITSLISGYLAGYTAFFFMLTFTALYYIYSAPPTRFKLIPFFSSFIIGLCSLTAVMAGFFLLSPLKYVSIFPPRLALTVVVTLFLLTGTRDMKDIEGDKAAGIKTVPIIFGNIWGPRVVGILAALSFLLVPIFLKNYILFASAILAAINVYYFVNRKPYEEKYIFRVYFAFLFASFLLLLI